MSKTLLKRFYHRCWVTNFAKLTRTFSYVTPGHCFWNILQNVAPMTFPKEFSNSFRKGIFQNTTGWSAVDGWNIVWNITRRIKNITELIWTGQGIFYKVKAWERFCRKRAKYLKTWAKMCKIWKYFEKRQLIACDNRTQ